MRSAVRSFAIVFALGVVALLCVGLVERRSEAFTLGVQPSTPIYLGAGHTLCQSRIEVPADFSAVRLTISAAVVSSPPATVRVTDAADGRLLGTGTLRGGYPSRVTAATVPLTRVGSGRPIRLCIHTARSGALVVYGNASASVPGSAATLDGRPRKRDVDIVFLREHRTSLLALAGDMVERASLFHGGWVGAWTIWALAALLLTAFPALLGLALARAGEPAEDQPMASASE